MDLKQMFLDLLLAGKTIDEAEREIVPQHLDVDAEVIAKASADALAEFKKLQSIKTAKAEITAKAEFESQVKAAVAEQLKTIDTGSIHKSSTTVQVKDNWQERYAKGIQLLAKRNKSANEMQELADIQEKMVQKAIEHKVILPETDASGGYFADPEFDMEVDKLLWDQFPLMNLIRMRAGGLKTEINSMSTFDFAWRTNNDTAFTEATPTFAQVELEYQDAGGLIYIANKMIGGSAYNLIAELTQGIADAKGRFFTEQMLVGKTSGDKFNGMWFTTSITSVTAQNSGGSGKITCRDLTNMHAGMAGQSRGAGVFVMDTREILVLAEEKDSTGQLLGLVYQENGIWRHKTTGKQIIPIDQVSRRSLNGYSASSGGSNVCVMLIDPARFRAYQLGASQIDTSQEFKFDKDQLTMRYMVSAKWGIPTYSLSSFVGLSGIVYNAA